MTKLIYAYTEDYRSPRFSELLTSIRENEGLNDYPVFGASLPLLKRTSMKDVPVVVFGNPSKNLPEGPKYIHTYSVAQALTKPNALTVIGAALKMGAGQFIELYKKPVVYITSPDTITVRDELIKKFIKSVKEYGGEIVIDIETSGNLSKEDTVEDVDLLTVALYHPASNVTLVVSGTYYFDSPTDKTIRAMQLKYLFGYVEAYCETIYHNGKFDVRVLNRVLGRECRVDHDTMLMHHTLFQAAGVHGLKQLCKLYFSAPDWDAGAKKYTKAGGHYENIPYPTLAEYNAEDVYWTYQLFRFLKNQLAVDEENLGKAYQLEMAAQKFLLKVEQRGIPVNLSAMDELEASTANTMQINLVTMRQITLDDAFNPNSPQQVRRVLRDMGVHVDSTSVDVLMDIHKTTKSETIKKFLGCLLEYRKAAKVNGTYVKGWRNQTRGGRVHPTFFVHGTSTGRLSSKSPNAQNMPRDAKVRKIVGV